MKVVVTGAAGFIGSAVVLRLLERGETVVGIDNHNQYYDPQLKEDRLSRQVPYPGYTHVRGDIADQELIDSVFNKHEPQRVVNLAAQAGVRYSLENPQAYVDSNLVGFGNILEACRNHRVEHLVYASSSSVYGGNRKMPFSVSDQVNHPVSLYAATKKSNELMAHAYSHLYRIPATGLRFFTVYGPWDRPDMALQRFASGIMKGEKLKLYNYGNHRRDFTYIDDIVEGVVRVLDKPAGTNPQWNPESPDPGSSDAPWRIYNIGSHHPIELRKYIKVLEDALGKKADTELLPLQPGDVPDTYADIDELIQDFDYQPKMEIEEGVQRFADWFLSYYFKKQ